ENGLEMFVDGEVEAYTREKLVRAVEQRRVLSAERFGLGVAVQDVAAVGREVDRTTQAARDEADDSEVAYARARPRAALHLVEAGEVVGFVRIPAVERNYADAERVVRPRETNLRARDVVRERRLAVEPVDEGRVGQIRGCGREGDGHGDRQRQRRRRKSRCGEHDAGQNAADGRAHTWEE